MPTPSERRALLFIAAVAALGTGVRAVRAARGTPAPVSDREALAAQIARVDSAIATGGRTARAPRAGASREPSRPESTPGPIAGSAPERARVSARRADPLDALRAAPLDLDVADAAALDVLPGIGPALAARIVADREANGPFGSLEGLQRVKGVGPALAARVAPFVTFSLAARQQPMVAAAHQVMRRP